MWYISTMRRPGFLPALPRSAWVVLGGDFLSAVGSGLTVPVLFLYAHRIRGLDFGTAGLVVSTIALASLAGNPLGGAMADRWTPRRALMTGLVVAAIGSVGMALARSEVELFAAAAGLGLGASIIFPTYYALLASLTNPDQRSAVFSLRHASLNAGLGLGALGAAAVISISRPGTFTAVYVADAVSFLAFLPFLARLRVPVMEPASGEEREPEGESPRPGHQAVGWQQILRDSVFVRVWMLGAILMIFTFGQLTSSFQGFATRPGGIGSHGLALAFAANSVTVVTAQLFVLKWLGGHRRSTGLALSAVACAVSWILVAVAGHLGTGTVAAAGFILAGVVFAIGECMISPTLLPIINDIAPAGAAGRYNGLGALVLTAGFLVGPAVGGAALGAGWGAALFVVLAGVCLAVAGAAWWLGRYLPAAANLVPRSEAARRDG
jgi:MFS family permease